jgi:hypothetical protein
MSAPGYTIARLLIERGLGIVYLMAFLAVVRQFRPLLGEHGLMPVPAYLRRVRFRQAPSLFHWRYTDRVLAVVGWVGVALAAAMIVGLPQAGPLPLTMLAWGILWALYLSIVNVGQAFYSFGWESLLLEAGFLAIFLGNAATAPPTLVLLLFRWLTFRVEFGAGLIKMRGDRCWRDLTCLDYHHETQPMPNPLSWYFHHLPKPLHRVEVLGNHFAQLIVPFGLFAPEPVSALAAVIIILTQGYLVVSGNYAWLNAVTIVAAFAALPDWLFRAIMPLGQPAFGPTPLPTPLPFQAVVAALTIFVLALSYWPVRNLLGQRQLMNYTFNSLHLVNTYGAFGSVTKVRYEIVVEGTTAADLGPDAVWHEYEFMGKPGDPHRRPPQLAPYHLRLDWLMWFAALSPAYAEPWFMRFAERLLMNDRGALSLIRRSPFPDAPPRWVRARFYRYRYTSWSEHRQTGAWWVRTLVDEYLPPIRLRTAA